MSNRNKESKLSLSDIFYVTPCLTLDQLMAYAEDHVTAQDRFEIENHLVDCKLCSDALEGFTLSEHKKNIHRDVKALNKKIHGSVSSCTTLQHNWRLYYSLAAMLVLAFTSILYFQNKQPSHESLFTEYFKPYPNTIPLVRGEESAGLLESAMVEYESEKYKESLIILQNLLYREPENDNACFYAGISYLCLNDPQSAMGLLQKVVNNKRSDLADQATWYLALAYIKQGNIQAAKISLNDLCSKENDFKEKSIDLMRLLK